MTKSEGKIIFLIGEALKNKTPGTAIAELRSFEENEAICPVKLITSHFEMTEIIRNNENLLLLSYMQPHKAAHVDTIRRWITDNVSVRHRYR